MATPQPRSGAYGMEGQVQLRQQAAQQQAERLRQLQLEQQRLQRFAVPKAQSTSPDQTAAPKDRGKRQKITKLVEVRAGYYEQELLKELRIRKDDVEDDDELVYKEFVPVRTKGRKDDGGFELSPSQTHSRKPHSTKVSSESSSVRSSYKSSARTRYQSNSFSSPLKPVAEADYKPHLDRSFASAKDRVQHLEQGDETRRQRILEKSILDLDQKLAKLAHKHSSSLSQASKSPAPAARLLRDRY